MVRMLIVKNCAVAMFLMGVNPAILILPIGCKIGDHSLVSTYVYWSSSSAIGIHWNLSIKDTLGP